MEADAGYVPPFVEWDQFIETWPWQQGEHVAIIGPTKSGKSVLIGALTQLRQWVIVLGSKKKDATYDEYLTNGFERFTDWPPPKPRKRHQQSQRLLQWPKIKTMDDLYAIGPKFKKTLENVFIDEGWTVCLDDLYYLSYYLKLNQEISALNYQVRSMGVTLVSAMQRPSWVPISSWDQSMHAFVSQMANIDDLNRIRGLAPGLSARELQQWMLRLGPWEWLYLPVRGVDYEPVIVKPTPLGVKPKQ